jgi:Domain of Unknown Function (DUF1206)
MRWQRAPGTKIRSGRLNKRRTECDVKRADLAWSVPVMRVGYAGRGLVYLTVASFSLYAIWRGEQPPGTASTLSQLETTGWGSIVLLLIFLGTFAFAVWNVIDSLYRLESVEADGEGIVARAGKVITALIYGGVGGLAFSLLGRAFSWLVNQPYGQVLVAAICAGLIAFALFCFVNAGYRVIPKVSGGDIETLAAQLASKVRQAT